MRKTASPCWLSPTVIDEALRGSLGAAAFRQQAMTGLPVLGLTAEASYLAQLLL